MTVFHNVKIFLGVWPFFQNRGLNRAHHCINFLWVKGIDMWICKSLLIIIKMKENVYDHEHYKNRIKIKRKTNPTITFYRSLKRLSNLLYYTVFSSLITSFLQFTVGFVNHWLASLICSYSAIVCIFLFAISLFIIKQNLDFWFGYLEKDAYERGKKTNKALIDTLLSTR